MIANSSEETRELAQEFIRGLLATEGIVHPDRAFIVELVGNLGAGKTTFMSGVGQALGVKETIISPTFLIQRNYDINGNFPWKRLVHLDAYRIEEEKELEGIDWEKYSKDPENIIFIEWPANMKIVLDADKKIEFEHISEQKREIKF